MRQVSRIVSVNMSKSNRKVVTSSVALIPPHEEPNDLWPQIQSIRKIHDKSYVRWCVIFGWSVAHSRRKFSGLILSTAPCLASLPLLQTLPHSSKLKHITLACRMPHINLLYPFVPNNDFPNAVETVKGMASLENARTIAV